MKLYTCSHCNNQLYFENNICLVCNHMVGFDAVTLNMITLRDDAPGIISDIRNKRRRYRWCANAAHGTCNWLVPARDPSTFCVACRLNRTIPTLSDQLNLTRWKRIEIAKHRLVYSLLRLHLPVIPKQPAQETISADSITPPPAPAPDSTPPAPEPGISSTGAIATPSIPEPSPDIPQVSSPDIAQPSHPAFPGIAFDFMADISPEKRILTGHSEGVITLNIEEADEAERARNKEDLGEKYRTLLGHFRHEIGHYYWDLLIKDSPSLDTYRSLFGDERKDYQQSLKDYYAQGAPADWIDHFISPYASAHPWEDWAETWAHYMHMMDTLETAYAFGLGIHAGKKNNIQAEIRRDPYELADFNAILRMWLPLTFAVNSLNRSMGHADFYPFVISSSVVEKLRFIHEAVSRQNDKLVS